MEEGESSLVSNTDATICNTADLCSAWGSSLISGPNNMAASSDSTSIGDDMIASGASSRPFNSTNKQSHEEQEIRIFNVIFRRPSEDHEKKRSENNDVNSRNLDHLGKNIAKNPIVQPNLSNANGARQQPQPQPQVYNINKNDFQSIVQQLVGSPSQMPHQIPQSTRLQSFRPPPPIAAINHPPIPIHPSAHINTTPAPTVPYNYNNFTRPPQQYGQPSHLTSAPDLSIYSPESPVSAYMRYLQNALK